MTIKLTVRYEFQTREDYSKFWEEHINKLFDIQEELPVSIKAISRSDMFKTIEDIEELLRDEDMDMYCLPDMIEDIIEKSYE